MVVCGWLVNCVVGSPERLFPDDNLMAIAHIFYGLAKLKLYCDQLGEVDGFVAVMEICLLLVYPPHFEEHAKNCTMYGAHKIDTIAHKLCEEVVGEHV